MDVQEDDEADTEDDEESEEDREEEYEEDEKFLNSMFEGKSNVPSMNIFNDFGRSFLVRLINLIMVMFVFVYCRAGLIIGLYSRGCIVERQ